MFPRLLPIILIALASHASAAPNIILIMSDDMGFTDVGCYGGEIKTPTLDKLAANGLRFTQFYNTGRCCPTRASLLTGLYPHQAGVGHMTGDMGHDGYRGELNKHCVTIAQVLKGAGYGTYAVGKWHVVNNKNVKPDGDKANWPRQRGFDRFYGTITGGGSFYDPGTLTRDNTMISPFADPHYQPKQFYYTDAIADHAVQFISDHDKAHQDRPLFLYVAFTAAHWPMHALEEDIAKYTGKYDAGYEPIRAARLEKARKLGLIDASWPASPQVGDWSKVADKAWEARCMETYAAMVDRMDQGIGRIVDALRAAGRLDDTLIFFLQDNGGCQETIGRQKRDEKPFAKIAADAIRLDVIPRQTRDGRPVRMGPGVMPGPDDTYIAYGENWANVSNTPFRLYKHYVHEGGVATPLIVHWPARVKAAGALRTQPGHLIDIMATCVDVAKAAYPTKLNDEPMTPLEGRSLVPAFDGQPIEREAIYWEHESNRAIRHGRWKLVAKGDAGPWELYDLEADRTELNNLADKKPELVRQLATQWEAWADRAHVLPVGTWRGKAAAPAPPAGKDAFSKEKRFELKAGDELPREKAPDVRGKALRVTAEVKDWGEGVILAHGGSAYGYTLYVKDRKLHFATRVSNKLTTVAAKDNVPDGASTVVVDLSRDGKGTITLDGKPIAIGGAAGPLTQMPVDGLEVGRDGGGQVGDYEGEFAFKGKLGNVVVEVD